MFLKVDEQGYVEKTCQGDIVSVAMRSGVFDTDGLVDQAKTLLGAGHETYVFIFSIEGGADNGRSAGALAWALHILSQPKHAHIQEILRQEIRAHLPSPSSGMFSFFRSACFNSRPIFLLAQHTHSSSQNPSFLLPSGMI